MKKIAFRAMFSGLVISALFGAFVVALDQGARSASLPSFLSWPLLAYMVSGVPLAWLLEHVPGYGGSSAPFAADGAMGTAILKLLVSGWLTWAVVVSSALYLRWRRATAAPNNSFKPKPLRGSA